MATDPEREKALLDYKKKLLEHKEVETLLGDLKRQMKDLSTAFPQPDHDGQFITQQSTVAVKEDPEDEEDLPQSL
jgi:hypothetical protein